MKIKLFSGFSRIFLFTREKTRARHFWVNFLRTRALEAQDIFRSMEFQHHEQKIPKSSKADREGHTLRKCYHCNKDFDGKCEFYYLDENGTRAPVLFSLNKANRWELLKKDNVKVEVVPYDSPSVTPSIYQGMKKKTKGYNAADHHEENVSNENTRQARKEARRNRAKNNKNARSGHKKESMKKNEKKFFEEDEEEDVLSSSSSSTDSEEEWDGVQVVEDQLGIRVVSKSIGAQSLAYLRCYQCSINSGFAAYSDEKLRGQKGTKRDLRYEMKDY